MSRPANQRYRGRYNAPLATSNLLIDGEDFPEFESFEDKVTPRFYQPGTDSLLVQHIDMCQQVNKPEHQTVAYDTELLVVRRGQPFVMRVTFNRAYMAADDFQVQFMIGADPSSTSSTLVTVAFGPNMSGSVSSWAGVLVETQGSVVTLRITPSADAIVGKYRTYVCTVVGGRLVPSQRDPASDMYLLFNAWCPDDPVYLPHDQDKMEYVLNDIGVIFQGTASSVSHRTWMYGQFEQGVLDACIQILDASLMPIQDRGNIVKVIRKGSAMINSQDDNGVCVGNWSDDYSMGVSPTSWTGSVKILLQYANTGVPVCYAQCWVFAGVFNTFLRCLGIPCRVITNFSSAHDNTGNLKTDLIFNSDGTPDERNTRDSIWNYHCWNEVYTIRQDLPTKYSGWQVVDATPQETSDGHFRCGPASVLAIKEGQICYPFDCGFVFAEVNSDVVCHKRDRYGNLTPFRVEKTHVGQLILTKAVNASAPQDITLTYKFPEGSAEDSNSIANAESFGASRNHSDMPSGTLSVTITCGQVMLGQDINLMIDFHNQGGLPKTVQAHLVGAVIFYTGVTANSFKDHAFTITVPAYQKQQYQVQVSAQEYLAHLGSQHCLQFTVTGQTDDQNITDITVVELFTAGLQLMVGGSPQVGEEMEVTVTFTNPFTFRLVNCYLTMEGPGLLSYRAQAYSFIDPHTSISWVEKFHPRLQGPRAIVAIMVSSNLHQVYGHCDVDIVP